MVEVDKERLKSPCHGIIKIITHRGSLWIVAIILLIIAAIFTWRPIWAVINEQIGLRFLDQANNKSLSVNGGFVCLGEAVSDAHDAELIHQAIDRLQRAMALTPGQVFLRYRLGQAYCLVGEYDEAIESFKQFSTNRPKNPQASLELGFALEKRCPPIGECEDGRSALGEWQMWGVTIQYFIDNGESLRQKENYNEAITWFERAQQRGVDLRSTIAYTHYLLFSKEKQGDDAYLALQDAISMDTGWANPSIRFLSWYRFGFWQYEVRRDYPTAEKTFIKVVEMFPGAASLNDELSEAYRLLGLAQFHQKRLGDALTSLEQAIEINPRSHWAHFDYGRVLFYIDKANVSLTEHEFDTANKLASTYALLWESIIRFWADNGYPDRVKQACLSAKEAGTQTDVVVSCQEDTP